MSERARHFADHGGGEVVVYNDTGRDDERGEPVLAEVVRLRAPDLGDVDSLLRLYGWRRISAWRRPDDAPGHRVAMVEPGPASASLTQLDADQREGDRRREQAT